MEKFACPFSRSASRICGYEEGGQLTKSTTQALFGRTLDEIEKAHRMYLTCCCKYWTSQLTGSLGRKVDFQHGGHATVGARQLKDFGQGVGFTTSAKAEPARNTP